MIENYTRLSSRMFTATVVGKDKNGRKITEGRETYKTPSGVYEIKDWPRLVEKAAEADGLLQYTRRKQAPRLAPRHMPELRPGVLGVRACASSKGSGSRWSLYRVRSQSRKHTGRR